jgi:sugar lactone lactonase YvrE
LQHSYIGDLVSHPNVYALLPDDEGGGALAGLYDVDGRNLVHLSPDGRAEPVRVPSPGSWVGGTDNAILRDRAGRLWVSTHRGGLFILPGAEDGPVIHVVDPQRPEAPIWATAMVEDPEEGVWVAGQSETPMIYAVWKAYPGGTARLVSTFTTAPYTMKLLRPRDGSRATLWVGGVNFLVALDPLTGEARPRRTGSSLQESRGLVCGLAADHDDTLWAVSEGEGLLRIAGDGVKAISLPGWPNDRAAGDFASPKVLSLKTGEMIVAAPVNPRQSRLWVRLPGENKFVKVGDTDLITVLADTGRAEALVGGQDGMVFALRPASLREWVGARDVEVFRQASQASAWVGLAGAGAPLAALATHDGLRTYPLVPRWNLRGALWDKACSGLKGRFTGACVLADGSSVVRGRDGKVFRKPRDGSSRELPIQAEPWTSYAELPGSGCLLRHENGTLSFLRLGERGDASVKPVPSEDTILALAVAPAAKGVPSGTVWVLGKERLYAALVTGTGGRTEVVLERAAAIPPENPDLEGLSFFAADEKGIWLGTKAQGLWYLPCPAGGNRPGGSGEPEWQAWDEREGLPAGSVDAIALPTGRDPVVFTARGPCRVRKTGQEPSSWHIDAPVRDGIPGSEVRAATLFDVKGDGRWTLALGTDGGVSFAPLNGTLGSDGTNSLLDVTRGNGLIDDDVRALHWVPRQRELWVGTAGGATALTLEALEGGKGSLVVKSRKTVRREQGLPAGPVTSIRFSADGNNGWLLVGNRVCRWDRRRGRVVAASEAFLFDQAEDIKLGPAIDGRPPRVLLLDADGRWSVWDPAAYDARPRLTARDRFFWLAGQLEIESLDPALDDPDRWEQRYSLGGQAAASSSPCWLPPDLWGDPGRQAMTAELRLKDGPPVRYVAVAGVEPHSGSIRMARWLVLAVPLLAGTAAACRAVLRRRRRDARLRRRENPYVVGEAIEDPGRFFGRRELLNLMRDTIATTSYALVGEFRIGKTSIQHQFAQLLESLKDPDYVFLPVFVDLQHLGTERGQLFFHFLGQHLLQLAKKHGVPDKELDRLEFREVECAEDYNSLSLKNDLELLLGWWGERFAPRKPFVVVQIDEITITDGFAYDTLLKFRAVFSRQPLVKSVVSGRRINRERDDPGQSPWWNFLTEIEVLPLTPAEARALIVEPARGLFTYDEATIQHLVARSEGKPFVLQGLCSDIVQSKYESGRLDLRVTLDDLSAALEFACRAGPGRTAIAEGGRR